MALSSYELEDRYTQPSGRVYLTGVQALVRLPLEQRRRDAAAGLAHGGLHLRLSRLAARHLRHGDSGQRASSSLAHHVRFEPGVNEDLAATAVWGSQQATLHRRPRTTTASSASGTARGPASIAPATR